MSYLAFKKAEDGLAIPFEFRSTASDSIAIWVRKVFPAGYYGVEVCKFGSIVIVALSDEKPVKVAPERYSSHDDAEAALAALNIAESNTGTRYQWQVDTGRVNAGMVHLAKGDGYSLPKGMTFYLANEDNGELWAFAGTVMLVSYPKSSDRKCVSLPDKVVALIKDVAQPVETSTYKEVYSLYKTYYVGLYNDLAKQYIKAGMRESNSETSEIFHVDIPESVSRSALRVVPSGITKR